MRGVRFYNRWIKWIKKNPVNYTVGTTTYVPPKQECSYEQLEVKTDKALKSADKLIKKLGL